MPSDWGASPSPASTRGCCSARAPQPRAWGALYAITPEIHPAARTALLPPHVFLGSAVRTEAPEQEVERWLAASTRPVVYVSLGSFLSVRSDVLTRIVEALRPLPVRVALASGSSAPGELGELPSDWLVRPQLPQVRLLQQAVLAVSHGGNNSVTEALSSGVPLVLLPLSTDQFAGAADAEIHVSLSQER